MNSATTTPGTEPATASRPVLHERRVEYTAGDGMPLHLVNVRGDRKPTHPPVILVHGVGMRPDSWLRAPIATNVVDVLVAEGHDVWLQSWRSGMDAPRNPWTLDQAAVHDHPAAVRKIVEETGSDEVRAVVQCMGSTSFVMSAVAGLLPQVSTIVSNSVSLHPIVPRLAQLKGRYLLPVAGRIEPYFDPMWGARPEGLVGRAVWAAVRVLHHECDDPVCRAASFIYGSGHPTLWRHENLNEETHRWLAGELAPAPRQFFDQMARCVRAERLLAVDGFDELPRDFTAQAPRTDARFVLLTGDRNLCFLPESQRRSYEFLERHAPGRHALHVLPGHNHLDVFVGKNAARDTYPVIARELAAA